MLPASIALHFRIALSHVDRAIDRMQSFIVETHRSETMEHLMLREIQDFCRDVKHSNYVF